MKRLKRLKLYDSLRLFLKLIKSFVFVIIFEILHISKIKLKIHKVYAVSKLDNSLGYIICLL